MRNVSYFNGGALSLILHDYYDWQTRNSEDGACYKAAFPHASPEPMWIQDAVHMRLVWVWATAGAKCQQDPRIGTQGRVGPRCGRYGSILSSANELFFM